MQGFIHPRGLAGFQPSTVGPVCPALSDRASQGAIETASTRRCSAKCIKRDVRPWQAVHHSTGPIPSMGLVYLPTFDLMVFYGQCRQIYHPCMVYLLFFCEGGGGVFQCESYKKVKKTGKKNLQLTLCFVKYRRAVCFSTPKRKTSDGCPIETSDLQTRICLTLVMEDWMN